MWYKRSEAQKRYSFFFSSTTLAGAFGGLLAAGIGNMNGMRGYGAWRWIFIIEGVITCLVAFLFFFIIPDFPEDAKWLTEEEREYVKARLRVDQGRSAADRQITLKDVANVFKDYKVIVGGFMYFGLIVPAYGTSLLGPSPFFHTCKPRILTLTRHRLRILRPWHHQNLRLLSGPNATPLRPALGLRLRLRHASRLLLRLPPPPLPLCHPPHLCRHRRLLHLARRALQP